MTRERSESGREDRRLPLHIDLPVPSRDKREDKPEKLESDRGYVEIDDTFSTEYDDTI